VLNNAPLYSDESISGGINSGVLNLAISTMSGQLHPKATLPPSEDFLYTLARRLDGLQGQHNDVEKKSFL
jgi:hypothetical protein